MFGIFLCMMICSFAAGVFHPFIKVEQFNIQRVHVFLFNLCTGGSILLMNSRKIEKYDVVIFLMVSFLFTISVAIEFFFVAILTTLILTSLVERVRIKNYSFFPHDFFFAKSTCFCQVSSCSAFVPFNIVANIGTIDICACCALSLTGKNDY